jgi:hypothetical protein
MLSPFLLEQNPAKDDNGFTGTIPTEIGWLTGLETLGFCTCYSSSIWELQVCCSAPLLKTAHIPLFCLLYTLPCIGFNQLTGSIPSEVGFLTALTTLEFGRCYSSSKENLHNTSIYLCAHVVLFRFHLRKMPLKTRMLSLDQFQARLDG